MHYCIRNLSNLCCRKCHVPANTMESIGEKEIQANYVVSLWTIAEEMDLNRLKRHHYALLSK